MRQDIVKLTCDRCNITDSFAGSSDPTYLEWGYFEGGIGRKIGSGIPLIKKASHLCPRCVESLMAWWGNVI